MRTMLQVILLNQNRHRTLIRVSRVPNVGVYVHVKLGDDTEPYMVRIVAVTHLGWERPSDGVAEIHGVDCEEREPDSIRSQASNAGSF